MTKLTKFPLVVGLVKQYKRSFILTVEFYRRQPYRRPNADKPFGPVRGSGFFRFPLKDLRVAGMIKFGPFPVVSGVDGSDLDERLSDCYCTEEISGDEHE